MAKAIPERLVNSFCPMIAGGYGNEEPDSADDPAFLKVLWLIPGLYCLDACVYQEEAQDDYRPIEGFDQSQASQDEDAAQNNGAENAPQQHAHLQFGRHLKIRKYDNEYQDVVHAECVFYEVAGQELDGFCFAGLPINPGVEA